MTKIALLGAGHLGTAIAEAILEKELIKQEDFIVKSRSKTALVEKYPGIQLVEEVSQLKDAKFLILAVKPQDFAALASEIKEQINADSIVISIMAGTSVDTIQKALGSEKVIRCIPNLGAQVGMSATVVCANSAVNPQDQSFVNDLFSSFGIVTEVDSEDILDAVVAVAGSGLGYVYYFMDALIDSLVEFGLSKEKANSLVSTTFHGAMHYAMLKQEEPKALQAQVTTEGGVTEVAIAYFDQNKLSEIIKGGVKKNYQRSKELSK